MKNLKDVVLLLDNKEKLQQIGSQFVRDSIVRILNSKTQSETVPKSKNKEFLEGTNVKVDNESRAFKKMTGIHVALTDYLEICYYKCPGPWNECWPQALSSPKQLLDNRVPIKSDISMADINKLFSPEEIRVLQEHKLI